MAYEDDQESEDSGILARARKWFRAGQPFRAKWAEQARECYAFRAGDQWSDDDIQKLKEEQRPVITFNRVGPVVNAITGAEVSNRQEVKYRPRGIEDTGVADAMGGAAEWVRDQCDAQDEESDAFEDQVICGMGWTDTRVEHETDPDGMILVERIDPFEMWWDHHAKKRNLDDGRYVMRIKDVDSDDAKAMFPDADEDELHADWAQEYAEDNQTEPHNATQAPFYRGDGLKSKDERKRCRIVEVQWFEKEKFVRAVDLDGQIKSFSVAEWKELEKRFKKAGVELPKSLTQYRRVYKRAFLGKTVLEEGPGPCKAGFTYRCMTGYRDRNNNTWYGIVKAALDPQRWANKWLAQTLHILNSGAKGGLMVETGATDDIRKLEQEYAKPGALLTFKSGALASGKVQERKQAQMPTGFEKAMEWGIKAIRDSTGVSVESQGLTDRQQAGVLEYQRKQATLTVLATLFDGLRRYRKEQGRILMAMIQQYISDGRLIRVVGPEGGEKYIPLMKLPETMQYDIVVDDAPDAPNMKERVWAVIQSMGNILQSAGPQIWAELVSYSPLPESLSIKLRQALSTMGQNIPPEIQKNLEEMQKTIQQLQEQNAQLKDKREETAAQIQMKQFETQADIEMQRKKLEADLVMKQAELQAKLEMQARELNAKIAAMNAEAEATTMKAESSAKGPKRKKRIKVSRDPETNKIIGAEVEETEEAPPPPPTRRKRVRVDRENGLMLIEEGA